MTKTEIKEMLTLIDNAIKERLKYPNGRFIVANYMLEPAYVTEDGKEAYNYSTNDKSIFGFNTTVDDTMHFVGTAEIPLTELLEVRKYYASLLENLKKRKKESDD